MDWFSRLLGTQPIRKTVSRPNANDPHARLVRFKKVYNTVLELINRPRNLQNEGPLLEQLSSCLDRIAVLLRDETRAPIPHACIQFANSSQLYAVIARAATVSQYEPVIRSTIAIFAALIDSEEEDFVSSAPFAKSLMRLIRRVVDTGNVLIGIETETAVLELLFTISAKIRLQPEILPVWFQSSLKQELEEMVIREKNSFVGSTQKDDFPLCYLLIDRVHHEGRIGDFARTGLLYIFEATGKSPELEGWIVGSDLPTLMASSLGALYSQLSRELSILHPDATLPAVLAMSDYSTTHPRATAESAFSERHRSHMLTFLSYLAFWQDILDHSRSVDVKQTLLDHFKILFLQQLLYPSLLQSSDTDGGSSVAVLTYLSATLESLDYPDLVHMILVYLLAIPDEKVAAIPSSPTVSMKALKQSASQTALHRRKSLMTLNTPKTSDDTVEPILFNLFDLITNSVISQNSQTAYAALKLTSTLVARQRKYALGSLLKVQHVKSPRPSRLIGALDLEVEQYSKLAIAIHPHAGLEETYAGLCDDVRHVIEAQWFSRSGSANGGRPEGAPTIGEHLLDRSDKLLERMHDLLQTFLTNPVDVNLALTQTIIAVALCAELRLDGWASIDPSNYKFETQSSAESLRPWQRSLEEEERNSWLSIKNASRRPVWSDASQPALYGQLAAISAELTWLRSKVRNLDQLITSRKTVLQASSLDILASEPPSLANSPIQTTFLEVPSQLRGPSRSSSRASSTNRGRSAESVSDDARSAYSRSVSRRRDLSRHGSRSPAPRPSIFRPPPPETPSTTDVLMQTITIPAIVANPDEAAASKRADAPPTPRSASLNHILTNIVVLQEFTLELTAVLQIRAAVFGAREVQVTA